MRTALFTLLLVGVALGQTTQPKFKLKEGAPPAVAKWFSWAVTHRQERVKSIRTSITENEKGLNRIKAADINSKTGTANGETGGPRMVFDTRENKLAAMASQSKLVAQSQGELDAILNSTNLDSPPIPIIESIGVDTIFPPQQVEIWRIDSKEIMVVQYKALGELRASTSRTQMGNSLGEAVRDRVSFVRDPTPFAIAIKGFDTEGLVARSKLELQTCLIVAEVREGAVLTIPIDLMSWVEIVE